MFNRIIVGIDGRQGGRDALAAAEAIAAPEAQIELVRTYPFVTAFGEAGERFYDTQMREEAEGLLDETARLARRPVRTATVRGSSPAHGLHLRAEETSADLIVVGNPHRSAGKRLVTGDTCRALLRSAPCAVAMVPPDADLPAPAALRVAVGYDGRPEAELALAAARDLARRSEVPLHVVTAVAPPRPFVPEDAYVIDFDAMVERGERRAHELLDALGDDIAGDVRIGAPADVLGAAAEHCDVLVVGSRGYGAVRRIVLGSTSEAMVAHAPCTVVVVPRVAVAADGSGAAATPDRDSVAAS